MPSVNGWQLNNTTKHHLPWPIHRQAMSPPCCPPATSHLPLLAAYCLPLAAQCWCWPVPIAAWLLVSHPRQSVHHSLSKQNKIRYSFFCLNCLNIIAAMPRQQLFNEGLLLFWGRWRLQWWWQQWWPMETAMAMAMAMADNEGNGDGQQWWWCTGQRHWQRQWPTAMATAMADSNCNGNGNGNRDGDSDCQWQRQQQWLTAMAMAMANGNCNCNGNGEGNSNCNGNGDGNGNDDIVVTTTDTREGCLFMCRQCAALWQWQRLASPPWTQRSVHCPALRHGCATAKSVCSFSRGGDPESSPWIVFYFFNYLFSLLNKHLFLHTN